MNVNRCEICGGKWDADVDDKKCPHCAESKKELKKEKAKTDKK